jgi:hypothetical protein
MTATVGGEDRGCVLKGVVMALDLLYGFTTFAFFDGVKEEIPFASFSAPLPSLGL